MTLQLHELIVKEAILTELAGCTKQEVLTELIEALKNAGRLTRSDIVLQDLLARERKGTTGIGQAVAIPHTCSSAVHQPMIAFGRSRTGIGLQAINGKPVNLIFLILGRINGESLQLKILARLGHILSMPGIIRTLNKLESPEEILNFLKAREESLGEIEMPEGMPSVCVVGAGNGGLAMAGHLALIGCRVKLFNRSEERLSAIKLSGGIQVTGAVNGFARLNLVTTNLGEALSDVELVMVVIPATGHREVARMLGSHLTDGQVVVLNPGRTGGALEFDEVFRQLKVPNYYFLAEAETLIYACRITNPGQVRIFGIKNTVPVATLPAYHITDVLVAFKKVLPQFIPGDNVLKTSLSNIGAVFHPALTVLNVAWIEQRKGIFEYYHEGASLSVAKVLEHLDAERVKVAEALGIRVLSAREWLYQAYGVAGDNLYEAMQANKGYRGIKAPNTINHRYVTEDVPTSLVPIASLGDQFSVPVPTIQAIIHLASILHNRNYMAEGRTVEKLGLAGLTVRQIRRLVEEGRK
ncbi:NAD/NADP octopine/nopaline dehydrogenase family protein [Candidatus Aerophobetes bacterium]|nr:NAD/NADP octopine/nopaline dehydrogenase family protein [Candidatus Aerophobetes bacterium]